MNNKEVYRKIYDKYSNCIIRASDNRRNIYNDKPIISDMAKNTFIANIEDSFYNLEEYCIKVLEENNVEIKDKSIIECYKICCNLGHVDKELVSLAISYKLIGYDEYELSLEECLDFYKKAFPQFGIQFKLMEALIGDNKEVLY